MTGFADARPILKEHMLTESIPVETSSVTVAGVTLAADLSGALYWEQERLLVVSDLHLEKGSSYAMRGVLLPPYDTIATLGRLGTVIARHAAADGRADACATRHRSGRSRTAPAAATSPHR